MSFALSVSLWFTGSEQQAIFVGLWVPSILALGAFATSAARGVRVSAVALFALGAGVSFIAFAALALLVAGAVLDGRDERARRAASVAPTPGVPGAPFALPRGVQATAQIVPLPSNKGEAA